MGTKVEISEKLIKMGYAISTPANADYILVNGRQHGRKTQYFKAKKTQAQNILSELQGRGFEARTEPHLDGYYDFYISYTLEG